MKTGVWSKLVQLTKYSAWKPAFVDSTCIISNDGDCKKAVWLLFDTIQTSNLRQIYPHSLMIKFPKRKTVVFDIIGPNNKMRLLEINVIWLKLMILAKEYQWSQNLISGMDLWVLFVLLYLGRHSKNNMESMPGICLASWMWRVWLYLNTSTWAAVS